MTHNVGGKKSGIKKVFQAQETPYGLEAGIVCPRSFCYFYSTKYKEGKMVDGTAESTILL